MVIRLFVAGGKRSVAIANPRPVSKSKLNRFRLMRSSFAIAISLSLLMGHSVRRVLGQESSRVIPQSVSNLGARDDKTTQSLDGLQFRDCQEVEESEDDGNEDKAEELEEQLKRLEILVVQIQQ
jgi:hypothetical protein